MPEEFVVALVAGHEEAEVVAEGGHLAAGAEDLMNTGEAELLEFGVEGGPGESADDAVDGVDALVGADLGEIGDGAFDDGVAGIAMPPGGAEGGVAFDSEEPGMRVHAGKDGFGEGTGAGSEFDDDFGLGQSEGVGEVPGEKGRAGADGSDRKGVAREFAEDEFVVVGLFSGCFAHLTSLYQVGCLVFGFLVLQ